MPFHYINWNLIRTAIGFGIIFLCFRQCSSQTLSPTGPVSGNSGVYIGCFSKRNFEQILTETRTNVIVYYSALILNDCFNACKVYFAFNLLSRIELIAIQNNLCMCIPIYEMEKGPIQLYRIEDTQCNMKSTVDKDISIGGTNSLAIYEHIRNSSTFNINSDQGKLLLNIIDDFQPEEYLDFYNFRNNVSQYLEDNSDLSNSKYIQPCQSEQCRIRFNVRGKLCKSVLGTEASLRFVNSYAPKSASSTFCVGYCNSLKRNTTSDQKSQSGYTYSVITTTYLWSPQYLPMELCDCTDDLTEFHPFEIETCSLCPTSLNESKGCSSFPLLHRVYYRDENGTRKTFTISNNDGTNCSENKKCKADDTYGAKWEGCPKEIVRGDCPDSRSGRMAFWVCNSNGKFIGDQPDYSNCSSTKLLEIQNRFNGSFEPNVNQSREILTDLRNLVTPSKQESGGEKGPRYFGHEITIIQNFVKTAVSSQAVNFDEREAITAEAIGVLGNLIATSTPWGQLNSRSRSSTATNLIVSAEETLFLFANASKTETIDKAKDRFYRKTVNPIVKDPNGFVVTLGAKQKDVNEDIKFPVGSDSFIRIPENLLSKEETVTFVGVIMEPKYVEKLTPPSLKNLNDEKVSTKAFNGKIISLTLEDKSIIKKAISKCIQVTFVHENKTIGTTRRGKYALGSTQCAFWNTSLLLWSTNGCTKLENQSNAFITVCECNHLTAFAVLVDVHGYIGKEDKGLEILSIMLCSLSIFCLVATVVILTKMRVFNLRNHIERTKIIKHLCINLIIGNLLILLLVDPSYFKVLETEAVCAAVGILTHYVYLTAFCWMAVQGFYLYRMVVLVFDQGKNYMPMYTIGAYCFPLLPVALTVAIGYGVEDQPYGGKFCWLSKHYIWTFLVPVAVILLGNFVVMGLAVQVRTSRRKRNSKLRTHSSSSSNGKFLLGCFTTSVLLGLTWITGFFALLGDESMAKFMSYVFTILNASQGVFIFVFYCILHEKMKPMIMDKIGKLKTNIRQKKDSKLSTTATDKTETEILDKPPGYEEKRNAPQSDAHFETVEPKYDNGELPPAYYEYEDINENPPWKISLHNALSSSFQSKLESKTKESENHPLCKNEKPYPESPIRQIQFEDNSESDYSEDDSGEYQQRRVYPEPPYMEELLESELYLEQCSKIEDPDEIEDE